MELSGSSKQGFLKLGTPAALQLKRIPCHVNKMHVNWVKIMLIDRSQKVIVTGNHLMMKCWLHYIVSTAQHFLQHSESKYKKHC